MLNNPRPISAFLASRMAGPLDVRQAMLDAALDLGFDPMVFERMHASQASQHLPRDRAFMQALLDRSDFLLLSFGDAFGEPQPELFGLPPIIFELAYFSVQQASIIESRRRGLSNTQLLQELDCRMTECFPKGGQRSDALERQLNCLTEAFRTSAAVRRNYDHRSEYDEVVHELIGVIRYASRAPSRGAPKRTDDADGDRVLADLLAAMTGFPVTTGIRHSIASQTYREAYLWLESRDTELIGRRRRSEAERTTGSVQGELRPPDVALMISVPTLGRSLDSLLAVLAHLHARMCNIEHVYMHSDGVTILAKLLEAWSPTSVDVQREADALQLELRTEFASMFDSSCWNKVVVRPRETGKDIAQRESDSAELLDNAVDDPAIHVYGVVYESANIPGTLLKAMLRIADYGGIPVHIWLRTPSASFATGTARIRPGNTVPPYRWAETKSGAVVLKSDLKGRSSGSIAFVFADGQAPDDATERLAFLRTDIESMVEFRAVRAGRLSRSRRGSRGGPFGKGARYDDREFRIGEELN